ncbi:glycosyltransferase [Akkermansiaceae bacterium]|nr:glycosyltransferase [Akkermansiaceae bacterium]
MKLWAELFEQIIIYTDPKNETPLGNNIALPSNCKIRKIFCQAGPGLGRNFLRLCQMPYVFIHLALVIRKSEFLLIRSPGITALAANILNKFFDKPAIVKWATQFQKMDLKARALHLELSVLQKPPSNTRVLVYGETHNPRHISFYPALMKGSELQSMGKGFQTLKWEMPFQLLCVGRLFIFKDFDFVIKGLAFFSRKFPDLLWSLTIVGEGNERENLENQIREYNLSDKIMLIGARSFDDLLEIYAQSHISIIPGRYEGWCKVINESWATQTIPLVVNEGNAPYILEFGEGAGLKYDHQEAAFARSLELAFQLNERQRISIIEKGLRANEKMSLENFQKDILEIIQVLNENDVRG